VSAAIRQDARTREDAPGRWRPAVIWAVWSAGPLAWAIHLGVSYAIVHWVCATGHEMVLHAVTAGTLLLAAGGLAAAWRLWRAAGARWPDEGGDPAARTRFMAAGAVVFALLFAVAIAAGGLFNFLLDPCL
jgi:hypothetical protein